MIILMGASGFLGRHFCECLERKAIPAIVVSRNPNRRYLDRFAPSLKCMDAAEFALPAGQEVIAKASAVVYFIWRSIPGTFANEPWREIVENVEPAFEFFMRVANVSRDVKIVLLSSGGTVYGRARMDRVSEDSATKPICSYGLGKLFAEQALSFVGQTKGTPFAILRVSNAVGRWQIDEAQGIVGVTLRAARNAKPLRLFAGGAQVRDFVDADDVAEAIYLATVDRTYPAAIWNVGSGIGVTVIDLVQRASKVIGRTITIENAPPRGFDVPHIVLDCRKIARELGWTAKTPIERSIAGLWSQICGRGN